MIAMPADAVPLMLELATKNERERCAKIAEEAFRQTACLGAVDEQRVRERHGRRIAQMIRAHES